MSCPFESGVDLARRLLSPGCVAASLRVDEREALRLMREEMTHLNIARNVVRVERSVFAQWKRRLTREETPSWEDCACAEPSVGHKGTVYFVEAAGANRIKIGWTGADSARDRVRALQTASPFELGILLEAPGTMADEQKIHAHFDRFRVAPTTEWFHANDALWSYMLMVASAKNCRGHAPTYPCEGRTVLVPS